MEIIYTAEVQRNSRVCRCFLQSQGGSIERCSSDLSVVNDNEVKITTVGGISADVLSIISIRYAMKFFIFKIQSYI